MHRGVRRLWPVTKPYQSLERCLIPQSLRNLITRHFVEKMERGLRSEVQRAVEYANLINYPIEIANNQRIIGPRTGMIAPSQGCEIYITNLPYNLQEADIMPYFMCAGELYKFRLMLPSAPNQPRCAYATYATSLDADTAVNSTNNLEIQPGCTIFVKKSKENRRLFLGGIPELKTKDEIWHELAKLGMKGIVDVIMYRSYTDKNKNRGFVFVEFSSHEDAILARKDFKNLILFSQRVHLDWSTPLHDVSEDTMQKVKKLFLRNLIVSQDKSDFEELLVEILGTRDILEKIYKYRDYAFIHFTTRRDAQRAMSLLKDFFSKTKTDVQVEWAKPPPNKHNTSKLRSSKENEGQAPSTSQSTYSKYNCNNNRNILEEIIANDPNLHTAHMLSEMLGSLQL